MMVVEEAPVPITNNKNENEKKKKSEATAISTYLGVSFAIYVGFLPHYLISSLQSKVVEAEEELSQMKCRRKEDSKANARVVEIFASHRNGWRQEEKRLLQRIDASAEEIGMLRARIQELEKSEAQLGLCVDKLQRDVDERDEMINFMSHPDVEDLSQMQLRDEFLIQTPAAFLIAQPNNNNDNTRTTAFPPATIWHQDLQCDSLESSYQTKHSLDSPYQTKHYVARRESPWKVDGESIGVPSKLKVLEQELINLEKNDKGEFSKIPSLLRKQARRYQALAGKIDDLCRKMRASEISEATLSFEFRTRYQTEFLIEAYRLQQRASEIGQKLSMLQSETANSNLSNDIESHAKLGIRRSLGCIRNNLREIQRNLEVWLARILGDLEGVLARDGASRVREYYMT